MNNPRILDTTDTNNRYISTLSTDKTNYHQDDEPMPIVINNSMVKHIDGKSVYERVILRIRELNVHYGHGYLNAKTLSESVNGRSDLIYTMRKQGSVPKSQEYKEAIAKKLEVNFDWLFYGEGEKEQGTKEKTVALSSTDNVLQLTAFVPAYARQVLNIKSPAEIKILNDYMEPILKYGSTILYDQSEVEITNRAIYVFKDHAGLIALNAESVPLSDPQTIKIWGEQNFAEVIVTADRLAEKGPYCVGVVRVAAQHF